MAEATGVAAGAKQKMCTECGSSINAKAEICPKCGVRQLSPVSKGALLLITFFLGGLGGHKFYLGKNLQGVLYLLFCWTGIPGLIALFELLIYIFTSPEQLNEKYSANGSAAVVIAVGFGMIMLIGILAAIALPAYHDYTIRAKISEGILAGTGLRTQMVDALARSGPSDLSCNPEKCPFTSVSLAPTKYVKRMSSNKAGVITVEYDESVLRAPANVLTFTPQSDGVSVDLSDPGSAGKQFGWKCGLDASTTIAKRYLPASCR